MAKFNKSVAGTAALSAGLLLALNAQPRARRQCCDVDVHTPPRTTLVEPTNSRPTPPRHVKIGEVVYTIALVPQVAPAGSTATLSGKTCDNNAVKEGWCNSAARIYLRTGRTLQNERTTLLHEIQHVILGTEKSDDEATYHQFIYALSPTLLQVLQENPELYFYLTAPAAQTGSPTPPSAYRTITKTK